MEVLPIRQIVSDDIDGVRFGDVLKTRLEDERYSKFYLAVAFLRRSGFDYIGEPLSEFLDRDGEVYGVAGVDNKVTTREALEQLSEMATQSTIFNTTSDFIFHPKFYVLEGDDDAALIIGSGNLTRDGLFRNVEFGTVIEFDLSDDSEAEQFAEYKIFLETLLDESHPNVQSISEDVLDIMEEDGTLVTEREAARSRASESGDSGETSESGISDEVRELFPTQDTPSLPTSSRISAGVSGGTSTSTSAEEWDTFVLQLSPFDSSHQPGTPGTPEVLIPMDAIDFFPEMTDEPRKHPDVYFDAELQTSGGSETLNYRFWYYDDRREWRLNVRDETMEQVSPSGGSILVISKENSTFKVRVVNHGDEDFEKFRDACTKEVGEKVWGFID
jgi:HKD family nuclease